jgi:teichuronic acid biosynthesis glycosyltransferase TuaH
VAETETLEGSRQDLIVYFATGWWDGPAGSDKQLAGALTAYGPVLYVDPPISALTRLRKPHHASVTAGPRLRVHTPRLAQLITLVTPGMTKPVLRHLRVPLIQRAVNAAIDKLFNGTGKGKDKGNVAALVSSRVDEAWSDVPARHRLLFVTDDLIAGAEMLGLPRERLVRAERVALRGADAVAVVSPGLQERYARDGIAAELVPNGCAPEVFADVDRAPVPDDVPLTGPIAGFVGYINDRIDLALLEAVADTGCSLLVVGALGDGFTSERFTALTRRPNVCWTGPRPYARMPSYLRLIDVGLTPYVDNAFNRASFPLKTLEYLCAGRAVVATPLPATTWLGTDLVATADTPERFAAGVRAALATARTEALVARRRAFAGQHSWQRRAEQIAAMAGLCGARTRTSAASTSGPAGPGA